MAKFTREDILKQTEKLANMISNLEEVDFYKRAEEQINRNTKVNERIAQMKKLQKQAVNLQHYGKIKALQETEAKINQLQQEIDELPIVSEFKESQAEVNDMLQLVTKTIATQVEDELLLKKNNKEE